MDSAVPEAGDFSSLGLPSSLCDALGPLGFTAMTAVQSYVLPSVLAGKDVIVQSEPGSGKTLAFGLGMLAKVIALPGAAPGTVRALAVCPTRELAEQIADELRRLARRTPNVKVLSLCGGAPLRRQRESLGRGAHVIVATPGRLEEHLRKGNLSLRELTVLVLDEADRMLSMGFLPQLEAIVAWAPDERQTLLFSATLPDSIAELAARYQRDPLRVIVAPRAASAEAASPGSLRGVLEQRFHRVEIDERADALVRWLSAERPASTLVFASTRLESDRIAEHLRTHGWVAASIHGELSQRQRAHVLRLFENESCSVLVATDVAARGWDIGGLSAVVNLGVARDPDLHLHRIGRTGRSGHPGKVAHFVAEEDLGALSAILRREGAAAAFSELPPDAAREPPAPPRRVTLLLGAGKNKKLRPGDILGALTADGAVQGSAVGLIHIDQSSAYVAVDAAVAERALSSLANAPIKGRRVKVRRAELSLPKEISQEVAKAGGK